jgi:chromosome segregation ATPase
MLNYLLILTECNGQTVIEYALIFGLGFMAAALLVMLVAPAVHQRIVVYTENRLKATMPLSPQEIRAQKDMVRAVYAAENARTQHELTREREKSIGIKLQNEALSSEAARLVSDSKELKNQIEEMSTEAADLRSRLRRGDVEITSIRETLKRVEIAAAAKDMELEVRAHRIARLMSDMDTMRIEAMSRDTEIDTLKTRIQDMRDEREELRRESKLLGKRAKDAELRLTQEEHKVLRLEDILARGAADRADAGSLLERRTRELTELRGKLKAATAQLRNAQRVLREAGLALPETKDLSMVDEEIANSNLAMDPIALENDIRRSQTALTERLLMAKASTEDDALREELGDIAAKMIVLTAAREPDQTAIADIISAQPKALEKPKSLVDRVLKIEPSIGRGTGMASPAE